MVQVIGIVRVPVIHVQVQLEGWLGGGRRGALGPEEDMPNRGLVCFATVTKHGAGGGYARGPSITAFYMETRANLGCLLGRLDTIWRCGADRAVVWWKVDRWLILGEEPGEDPAEVHPDGQVVGAEHVV